MLRFIANIGKDWRVWPLVSRAQQVQWIRDGNRSFEREARERFSRPR
jgi:hypothetical protein